MKLMKLRSKKVGLFNGPPKLRYAGTLSEEEKLDLGQRYDMKGSMCSRGESICDATLRTVFRTLTTKIRDIFYRKTGGYLELDLNIIVLNISLEYHGRQHFEWVKRFHKTRKQFEDLQESDAYKANWCSMQGRYYIVITYKTRYKDIPHEIVRQLIAYGALPRGYALTDEQLESIFALAETLISNGGYTKEDIIQFLVEHPKVRSPCAFEKAARGMYGSSAYKDNREEINKMFNFSVQEEHTYEGIIKFLTENPHVRSPKAFKKAASGMYDSSAYKNNRKEINKMFNFSGRYKEKKHTYEGIIKFLTENPHVRSPEAFRKAAKGMYESAIYKDNRDEINKMFNFIVRETHTYEGIVKFLTENPHVRSPEAFRKAAKGMYGSSAYKDNRKEINKMFNFTIRGKKVNG